MDFHLDVRQGLCERASTLAYPVETPQTGRAMEAQVEMRLHSGSQVTLMGMGAKHPTFSEEILKGSPIRILEYGKIDFGTESEHNLVNLIKCT